MSEELSPSDLADQVLDESPKASKTEWGARLAEVARAHGMTAFLDRALTEKLGAYVAGRKSLLAKRRQADDLATRAVGYDGTPLSPVISVGTSKGERQLKLWVDASPAEFMAAVFTEQSVVDGRNRANSLRMQIAEQIAEDETLQELSTLAEVCTALGVDPNMLGLSELAA